MLCADESAYNEGSAAVLIMASPEGRIYKHALKFKFHVSNNEAEYEVLLAANGDLQCTRGRIP